MRVIVLVGARPSIVKVAPLLPALTRAGILADVAFTGSRGSVRSVEGSGDVPRGHPQQGSLEGHVSFYGVAIPTPRWFLDVTDATAAAKTAAALVALERLLAAEPPDAVLAVGDLNPTLALAITASKLGIPVVHLEAGLRCGSLATPDEVNRVIISRLAAMHLAPDEISIANLTAEGVAPERIVFVGSMLAESVIRHAEEIRKLDAAAAYGLQRGEFVAACFHRPENLDDTSRCQAVLDGLGAIGLPVVIPDTNGVKRCVEEFDLKIPESVSVIGSVGYHDMLALVRDAAVVVTDSGGVQEEACMLGTSCVTVRSCTERMATLEVGANRLADSTAEGVLAAAHAAIEGPHKWLTPKRWDKAVSQRVVRALKRGVTPVG